MSRADQRFTEIANNIATIATLNAGIDESVLSDIRAELNKVLPSLAPQEEVETVIFELLHTTVTKISERDEPEKRGLVGFCELDGSLVQRYEKEENPLKAFFISELSVLREAYLRDAFPVQATSFATTESAILQQTDATSATPVDYSHADVVPVPPNQSDASIDPFVQLLLPTGQSELSVNALLSDESLYQSPEELSSSVEVEARRSFCVDFNQDAVDPMEVVRKSATQNQDTLLICKSKKGSGIVVLHTGVASSLLSSGVSEQEIIKGATISLCGDEMIFSKGYKSRFAEPLTKIVLDFLSYAMPSNLISLDQEEAIKTVSESIQAIRSRILVPEVMRALSNVNDVLDAAKILQNQYQTNIIEKLIFDLHQQKTVYEKRIASKKEYRGIGFFQSSDHSASKKKAAIVDVIAAVESLSRGEVVDAAEIARIRALPAVKEGTLKALCDRFYSMIPASAPVPSGPR